MSDVTQAASVPREADVEGEYDPTRPKCVNGKEWWIERIDDRGELETYAGCWPRAMMENAKHAPRQPIWVGASRKTGREFGIKFSKAFRHIALLGTTGAGKTVQMYSIATQWMFGWHGCAVIDPKADDIFDLLRRIPPWRWNDFVYMDLESDWYTMPDPETGEDVPWQVGFNILETYRDKGDPGYDAEVGWIVSNFLDIADIGESWSKARRIVKTMVAGMVRHPEEFTIVEIFYALLDEENRKAHADKIGEQIDDEDIMFVERFTRRIAEEVDESTLDPLIGKLKDWVEDPLTRNVVAQRNAGITLGEIVDEQKILVVNNDLPKEQKRMVAKAILSGIWSAVTSRKDPVERKIMKIAGVDDPGGEYQPFFLAIDECHSVLTDSDDTETMLMEARSKQLGMLLSTQRLRTLPDDTADAMLSECNQLIALNTNHNGEAREIAGRLGNLDAEAVKSTPDFCAQTQLSPDDEPFLSQLIPPYPPRLSLAEVYELILHSLRQYGTPKQSGKDMLQEMHYDSGIPEYILKGEDPPEGATQEDRQRANVAFFIRDEDSRRNIIKSIFDAGIRHGSTLEASEITASEVGDALSDVITLSETGVSNLVEMMETENYLRTRQSDGEIMVSVTSAGLAELGLGSGSGGSGGKDMHRYLIKMAYIWFTRVGYTMNVPSQDASGELPDAIGTLPGRLHDMPLSAANKCLREDYPGIVQVSGDQRLLFEAESKGLSRPGGPVKNYAKADGEPLVFTVADGGSKGFTNNARRLKNIFTDPAFVSGRCPADAERKFYRKNEMPVEHIKSSTAKSGTEYAALLEQGVSTEWVQFADDSIVCRTSDGEVIVRYEDEQAYTERSAEDFPAIAYYDEDREVHVLEYEDPDTGETREKKYGSKKVLRNSHTLIHSAVIPSIYFGDDFSTPQPEAIPDIEQVAEDILFTIAPDEPKDPTVPQDPIAQYDIMTGETTPLPEYLGIDIGERVAAKEATDPDVTPEPPDSEPEDTDAQGTVEPEELSMEERIERLAKRRSDE